MIKHTRDMDGTKHSSGCSFFHACTCGKVQKLREDPFDLEEANIGFYSRFTCCLADGRMAIDIQQSKFGAEDEQQLHTNTEHIPHHESALLYLGPASVYRNSIGLEKCEGFMNNTNYLLPWILAKVADLQKKEQAALKNTNSPVDKKAIDANEWPLPGKSAQVKSKSTSSPLSLEAFPALGTVTRGSTSNIVTAPVNTASSSLPETKRNEETTPVPKKERRRRDGRRRDREHRLEGLIRGYVGAEYECPHGHRFLSCGDGRICKIGHKGHPKVKRLLVYWCMPLAHLYHRIMVITLFIKMSLYMSHVHVTLPRPRALQLHLKSFLNCSDFMLSLLIQLQYQSP